MCGVVSVCPQGAACQPGSLGWSWLQSGASRAAAARGKEAVWLWLAGVVSTFARHPLGGVLAGAPEGVVGGGRGSKRTSQDWRKPKTLSKHVAGAAGANVSCCSLSTAREVSECVCVGEEAVGGGGSVGNCLRQSHVQLQQHQASPALLFPKLA